MRTALVAAAAALAVASTALAGAAPFPERIALPNGWNPEGIAIAPGGTFYVGSIPTGAIYRGDLRTGAGAVFVPGGDGKAAIGLALDRGRLFVAGGGTGKAFVYDARTGATIATYTLTTETTFVNDVVVTRSGVFFTDSVRPFLYRIAVGARGVLGRTVQPIPLSGDLVYTDGFNVNGIDATPNGRWLVVVQSNTGKLFRVQSTSGMTTEIRLANGESVPMGDGVLLDGRTLYVVQNRANLLAVIAVDRALTSGRVLTRITKTTSLASTFRRHSTISAGASTWSTRGSITPSRPPPPTRCCRCGSLAAAEVRHLAGRVALARPGYTVCRHTGATWFRRGRFSGRAASRGARRPRKTPGTNASAKNDLALAA